MSECVYAMADDVVTHNGDGYDWRAAITASRVARDDGGREACGYVDPEGPSTLDNVSPSPGRFAFGERDCYSIFGMLDAGTLLGLWHSHPGGARQPSIPDWTAQPRDVPLYVVVLDGPDALVLKFGEGERA